jgi:alpha-beta hydrolase superfamily lysophospholipase|tara:strand:- start:1082 stop:2047 length:966 start_codon:yes stop_codon:yes gene_type:complete
MQQTDLSRAQQQIKSLAQTLPEFGPEAIADPAANPTLKTYLDFYQLPEPSDTVQVLAGKLISGDRQSHLMLWQPTHSKATAVVVHGYLDHTGLYGHLIRQLLDRQFTVVCFDLIGHGLSSGAPASIDSFDEYIEQLNEVLKATANLCPAPLHGIGQSTGGGILLKQLLQQGDNRDYPFASLNLLAPLVQPRLWKLDRWLFKLARPFRPTMNRVFRKNSQDTEFLDFVRHMDPFQPHRLPAAWVAAMAEWVVEIGRCSENEFAINVIQGDQDSTLDWQHNMRLLQIKFPNMHLKMVQGAGHHMVNEAPALREEIFGALKFET